MNSQSLANYIFYLCMLATTWTKICNVQALNLSASSCHSKALLDRYWCTRICCRQKVHYARPVISTSCTTKSRVLGLTSLDDDGDGNDGSLSLRRKILSQILGISTFSIAPTSSLVNNVVARAANSDISTRTTTSQRMASKIALKSIKLSLQQLQDIELLIVQNDYEQVKAAIRIPPFTTVRKNCSFLIKQANNFVGDITSNEEQRLLLEEAYVNFKTGIESLDSSASLGLRGRKDIILHEGYDNAIKHLTQFVQIAEKSEETMSAAATSPLPSGTGES